MICPVNKHNVSHDTLRSVATLMIDSFEGEMRPWWGNEARPINAWMRFIHLSILAPGNQTHIAYFNNKVVGVCIWRLPLHLREQPKLRERIHHLARLSWYWLVDTVLYLFSEHPLYNNRMDEYIDDPDDSHDLPESTDEALQSLVQLGPHVKSALYRPDDMAYLVFLNVDPAHQRHGIGSNLFTTSLAAIPNVQTPFTANGQTIYGPQNCF